MNGGLADKKRYPGLYRLRGGLGVREKTTRTPAVPRRAASTELAPGVNIDPGRVERAVQVERESEAARRFKGKKPTPGTESLLTKTAGVASLLGKKPTPARAALKGGEVWKGMPADKFAMIAGLLGSAIAPDTPQGRIGAAASQLGSVFYKERVAKEEAKKLEEIKKESAYYKALLDIGKEERGVLSEKEKAALLAEAKKEQFEVGEVGKEKRIRLTGEQQMERTRFLGKTQKEIAAMRGKGPSGKRYVGIPEYDPITGEEITTPSVVDIEAGTYRGLRKEFTTPEEVAQSNLSKPEKLKILRKKFGYK